MKTRMLLGFVAYCLMLTACIPSITRVYHTPRVVGVVVDADYQPLAGVVVRHANYAEPQVVSDAGGHFTLPSVSSLEAVLLMVGHALNSYSIQFMTPTCVQTVDVHATMKMYHEETVYLDRVVLDSAGDLKLNQQDDEQLGKLAPL